MKTEEMIEDAEIILRDPYAVDVEDRVVDFNGVTSLKWLKDDIGSFGRGMADQGDGGPYKEFVDNIDEWMKWVPEKRTVIQAGGNNGMYARFYGTIFDKVISAEPRLDCFAVMQMNCQGDKYNLLNVAFDEIPGTGICVMSIAHDEELGTEADKENFALAHIVACENTGETQVLPLDPAMQSQVSDTASKIHIITVDTLWLNDVDLMHLDIEQREYFALLGATKTIERCRPTIIGECGGDQFELCFNWLREKDYVYVGKLHDHVWVPVEKHAKIIDPDGDYDAWEGVEGMSKKN